MTLYVNFTAPALWHTDLNPSLDYPIHV